MTARYLFALPLLWSAVASAELVPADQPGLVPAPVTVVNEQDQPVNLGSLMAGASPVILLPVFTRCAASCPVMVQALKKALAGIPADFHVVIFSFDPHDTAADLARFRKEEGIPTDWRLVRSSGEAATRPFFDQLNYHFMNAAGGFNHPNRLFVFSPAYRWSGAFTGRDFTAQELTSARRDALAIDHPSLLRRVMGRFLSPVGLASLGVVGMTATLGVIALVLWR